MKVLVIVFIKDKLIKLINMEKMIEQLNLAYADYEKCIDVCAAEHITGKSLMEIKEICRDMIGSIDEMLENL